MDSKDFTDKFKNLKVQENQDINILLLGESGVGKSTFINAIANYLHFKTFKKAEKHDLLVLIPASFHVFDESYEEKLISVGLSNNNEFQEVGAAATQDVKTYVFPIGEGKTRLRLIDTPGIGDPRGIKQDNINCEHILSYLEQLKELHAICFLMKPTNSRITVMFEYCLKEIFSRLDKSASNNLLFIFTNTRGTSYGPGDTLPCLKKLFEDIKSRPPHVDIPSKNNIFCFDNESFRFLAGVKQNVKFPESVRQNYIDSWNRASEECWRMITYIIGDDSIDGLKPHQMHNTMSINEARRLISRLSQPLTDISQLIIDNLHVLNRHKDDLKLQNKSLEELKKQLYMPVINLNVIKLTQPVTVCASSKCAEIYNVGTVKKWHYSQRCHDPCQLTNITKELIGDPGLIKCAAMKGSSTCTKCSCDFSVHMHVYYLTKTIDDKVIDETVNKNINDKKKALVEVERLIKDIDVKSKELEEERDVIIKSAAQFAHFLQSNAITPLNDSYKEYIEYLIVREKCLGGAAEQATINGLEYMLRQYEETKGTFENGLKGWFKQLGSLSKPLVMDAPSIIQVIHDLYHLKHNGKKIKELMTTQKTSREKEYESNCIEYVHSKATKTPNSDQNKKAPNPDQNKKNQFKKKIANTNSNEKQPITKPSSATDFKKKSVPNPQQSRFQRLGPGHHSQHPNVPPPPYSEIPQPLMNRRIPHPNEQPKYESSNKNNNSEQNIVVKVEVTKDNRGKDSGNRSDDSSHRNYSHHEPHASYGHPGNHSYAGSSQSYGPPPPPPPPHYDAGHYNAPPTGHYNPPPYHGSSGPYYGPPGSYYPPGPYGPPPSGPYPGPPSGSYHSPSGPYHGPPSGPYHGPPSGPHHGPPSGPHHGPPSGPYYGPPRENYNSRPPRPYNRQWLPHKGRGNYQKRSDNEQRPSRPKSSHRNEKKTTKQKQRDSSSDDSSS